MTIHKLLSYNKQLKLQKYQHLVAVEYALFTVEGKEV